MDERKHPLRLGVDVGHDARWESAPGHPQCHRFDRESIDAVDAALAARRPLLVRGEPGTGKSQLAAAVAAVLGRPLVTCVVDSRTEARDLMWRFDAVERLGKAQLFAGLRDQKSDDVEKALAERNYVRPRPLWWAFDWTYCTDELRATPPPSPKGWRPGTGVVVLIDEIDKADSDVPNGLLEALGNHRFEPLAHPVVTAKGREPLVILTTNEERALPDAFVRRCLVLQLALPGDDELRARANAHFAKVDTELVTKALELLRRDRASAKERQIPGPGQAEFLDLLRAVTELEAKPKRQLELMDRIARYVLRKHALE